MAISLLIVVSLAASASLCGWVWNQAFVTSGRRTTISWALGGFAVGVLVAATVAAIPLIQQHMTTSVPTASVAPAIPNAWPAVEQLRPSRPVLSSLKLAQDALRKQDFQLALDLVHQAEAVPNRTAHERYLVAKFLAYLHLQRKDYGAVLAAIDAQLSYPQIPPKERADALRFAAQLQFTAKQYEHALPYAREFLKLHPNDRSMRTLAVQSLYLLKQYDELEPALDALILDERAAGAEIPLGWLQMRIVLESNRPMADVRGFVEELARDHPEHAEALLRNLPTPRDRTGP